MSSSNLHELLNHLHKVRPMGNNKWVACCPAHNDRNPSLSVGYTGEKILVHCFAGCKTEDVLQALGLTYANLYPHNNIDLPDFSFTMNRSTKSQPKKSKIVTSYDYKDADGKLLFQVVRLQPKSFRQRRPDGKSGWTWNIKGVKRVLYRLPRLHQAIEEGKGIFFVEGEKDVQTLEELGCTATTCPMGAEAWREEYAEALAGATVAILPDCDEAGFKHARVVADSLHGVAKSVRIVELPGLEEGEDVSDWIAAGGTRDNLMALTNETNLYEPEANEDVDNNPVALHPPDKVSLLEAHALTETIPNETLGLLPDLLQRPLFLFNNERERDVFLSGSIGLLSGALVNVRGCYDLREYAPNLNIFISAPPSSGKGALNLAVRYVRPLHKHVLEESREAIREWEEQLKSHEADQGPHPGPKPSEKWLLLPGNVSASALIDILESNEGRAIMVETEADTISQVLGKEWGTFSDLLRKAYSHERISKLRLGGGKEIDWPCLSLVLSGTPEQIVKLIPSVENGLWSRFCFYAFLPDNPTQWRDVTPTKDVNPSVVFLGLSQEVVRLYEMLSQRSAKLYVELLPRHWKAINEEGQAFKERIFQRFQYAGVGVAHRMGVNIFRITMVLAVLRHHESGTDLRSANSVTATDEDFKAALSLGKLYARHSEQLIRGHKNVSGFDSTTPQRQRRLYRKLPKAFTTAEAIEVGEALGFAERTLKRRLKKWREDSDLIYVKRGHYRKP